MVNLPPGGALVDHAAFNLCDGSGLRPLDRGGASRASLASLSTCGCSQVNSNLKITSELERQIVVPKVAAKPAVVYVLEDDPDILKLIQHQLKLANFETVGYSASSGMLGQAA